MSKTTQFRDMTRRRNIEFARVGMLVTVDGCPGRITGSNYSDNLNVTFIGDRFSTNCHPHWKITYFDTDGSVIKKYED